MFMLRLSSFVTAGFVVFCSGFLLGQSFHLPVPQGDVNKAWMADKGNGTFKNPILHSDYSDPDAIRVGEDYFMTASSFNCAPGLPILHSRDMVNWTILTHVFTRQFPVDHFSKPQHGNGVWAPAILLPCFATVHHATTFPPRHLGRPADGHWAGAVGL